MFFILKGVRVKWRGFLLTYSGILEKRIICYTSSLKVIDSSYIIFNPKCSIAVISRLDEFWAKQSLMSLMSTRSYNSKFIK
jgi:hypothetical protein